MGTRRSSTGSLTENRDLKPNGSAAHHVKCRLSERPSTTGHQVFPMRRSLILAGSFLLIPMMVQAQGRGGAGMGHAGGMGMAARGASVAHAAPSAGGMAHSAGGTRIVSRSGLSRTHAAGPGMRVIRRTNSLRAGSVGTRATSADTTGVPGLGFDWAHYAAVHPNQRSINGRRNRGDFAAFFPFFDGGFFLPSSPVVVEDASAGDGQQEEAYADDPPQAPLHGRYMGPEQPEGPAVSRDRISEPAHAAEEYVFVRRDGSLFFAVAYAWDSGTLRYVTTEGLRRSVARDALDLDATQQFNEQRGMNFHSPA